MSNMLLIFQGCLIATKKWIFHMNKKAEHTIAECRFQLVANQIYGG